MQPIYNNARSNGRAYQAQFGGLNRSPSCADVEFADMQNLSSDRFPYLSPCRARESVASQSGIEAVIAPRIEDGATITAFTGVAGNKFYYNGTPISDVELNSNYQGNRCLVDFNGNILIFPDKQYYSYVNEDENGAIEIGNIADPGKGTDYVFHSEGSVEDSTVMCWITGGNWTDFSSGDSLVIRTNNNSVNTVDAVEKYKQADDEAIVSCVVNKKTSTNLYVTCINRKGEKIKFPDGAKGKGGIWRGIPNIVNACVHNNRVLGYVAGGKWIYASKLGDFRNWYTYEGLSTDGWYSEVGTEGEFTGIAACSVGVAVFKRNYMHLIYGDTPRNFTLQPAIPVGCIDGRSIADVQWVLFFLSYDGVYAFSGGYPRKISDALDVRYTEGIAGSDGKKYYLSGKTADGEWELVVYDLARGMWHKVDALESVGFFQYNNGFYSADSGHVYRMDTNAFPTEWYAVSKRFDDGTMDNRGLNNLYLRIHADVGATVTVKAKSGDRGLQDCGSITGPFHGVHRFPVRFASAESYQYKIVGCGHAEIEAIERVLYSGGREER